MSDDYVDPFDEFDDLDDDLDEELDEEGFESDESGEIDSDGSGFDGDDSLSEDVDNLSSEEDHDGETNSVEPAKETRSKKEANLKQPVAQVQDKPFLKKPLGMAVVGLGLTGLIGAGSLVIMPMVNSPAETSQYSEVNQIQPASEPVISHNSGLVNTSTQDQHLALVQQPALAQQPALVQQPNLVQQQDLVQQNTSSLYSSEIQPKEISLPLVSPQVPHEPNYNPGLDSGFVDGKKIPAEDYANSSTEIVKILKSQSSSLKDLKDAVSNISSDVKSIRARIDQNEKSQSEMRISIKQLSKKVDDIKNDGVAAKAIAEKINDSNESTDSIKEKAEALRNKVIVTYTPKKEEVSEIAIQVPALAKGKSRVSGFQVIDATPSGEMTIIKNVSTGRIFTVFKGEVLTIGGKKMVVDSIEEKGFLVLIGGSHFIDKNLEAIKPPVKKDPVKSSSPRVNATAKVSIAKGFTLNAVYDKDMFGVVTKTGEFKTYKTGDTIPELGNGRVTGIDSNGNLKVGNHIIKSIY